MLEMLKERKEARHICSNRRRCRNQESHAPYRRREAIEVFEGPECRYGLVQEGETFSVKESEG